MISGRFVLGGAGEGGRKGEFINKGSNAMDSFQPPRVRPVSWDLIACGWYPGLALPKTFFKHLGFGFSPMDSLSRLSRLSLQLH